MKTKENKQDTLSDFIWKDKTYRFYPDSIAVNNVKDFIKRVILKQEALCVGYVDEPVNDEFLQELKDIIIKEAGQELAGESLT